MEKIKQIIKKIPILSDIAKPIYRHFLGRKLNPTYWISEIVRKPNAMVVQIGSNDGFHGDPINVLLKKNSSWKCLLVEPVPYLFERLRQNYGDSARFKFVNAAINDGKTSRFYWVDQSAKQHIPDLPWWYDQLGSFNRDHIKSELDGVLEPYIVSRDIQGIRLPDLLTREGIEHIDVLHIDTEGYDWKVLSQLDLRKFNPTIILYEHKHLPTQEKQASIRFLKERYLLYYLGQDIMAINKRAYKAELLTLYPLRCKE